MSDRNKEKGELEFEIEQATQVLPDESELLTALSEIVDKSLFSDDELLPELSRLLRSVRTVIRNKRKLISELKRMNEIMGTDRSYFWLSYYPKICNHHLYDDEDRRTIHYFPDDLKSWRDLIVENIWRTLQPNRGSGISRLTVDVFVALRILEFLKWYDRYLEPFECKLDALRHSSMIRSCHIEEECYDSIEIRQLLEALTFFAEDEETAQAIPDMVYECVRKVGREGDITRYDEYDGTEVPSSEEWYSLFHKWHRYSHLQNALVRKISFHLCDTPFFRKLLDFDDWACSISGQVPLRQLIENHLNEE